MKDGRRRNGLPVVGLMLLLAGAAACSGGSADDAEPSDSSRDAGAGGEGATGGSGGGAMDSGVSGDAFPHVDADAPAESGVDATDADSLPEASAPDVPDVPPTPGTVIEDDPSGRTWPASHGEAMISLWEDDALGVLTITIDDNTAPDHAWWEAQMDTYGFNVTWFVITDRVESGAWWGTWPGFADLMAKGNDIQSHTVTHLGGTLTIEEEYRDSQQAILDNIAGSRPLTLAYPGGGNSDLNDPAVAAQYYIAARGTTGHDNPVGSINYMGINSISGQFILQTDHWAGLPNVVVYNDARPKSFRAWHCIHYHQVGDDQNAIAGFDFMQAHADDLWVGLFREVAMYGQEREAATLGVPNATDDLIELSLTDTLDDAVFDYPLTIKVGLADLWDDASATQGGAARQVEIVTHNGQKFALVRAVPDTGPVVISRVP